MVQPKALVRKLKAKTASKARRSRQSLEQRSKNPQLPPIYRPRLTTLKIIQQLTWSSSDLDSEKLPVASGSWIGKLVKPLKQTPWTLNELKAAGFRVVPWDGISVRFSHILTA